MKLDRRKLFEALKAVSSLCPQRNLPMLQYVLLRARNRQFSLDATDR